MLNLKQSSIAIALAVVCSCLVFPAQAQQSIYVAECGNDGWSGMSEECVAPDGPKQTIQAAIDTASSGDEVLVLPGTYSGPIDLLGKQLVLRGVAGAESTVISGGGDVSVVTCDGIAPPGTRIEGLTIADGVGTPIADLVYGGGLFIRDSHLTIEDCVIRNNEAIGQGDGGGGGAYALNSTVTIRRCTFADNQATNEPGFGGTEGGGLYVHLFSSVRVFDSHFHDNYGGDGGAISVLGYEAEADLLVVNSRFDRNIGASGGAGISMSHSSVTVLNCVFADGDILSNASSCGGIENHRGQLLCVGSLFLRNRGWGYSGGAIATRLDGATCGIINCTFVENYPNSIFESHEGVKTITNSILWANGAVEPIDGYDWVVTRCLVQGGWPGSNFDVDPGFVDPPNDDYRLSEGSVCIDAGHNRAFDGIPLRFDLNGDNRFVNDAGMPDSGTGPGPIVDVGAFEYQGTTSGFVLALPNRGEAAKFNRFSIAGAGSGSRIAIGYGLQDGQFEVPGCPGLFVGFASPKLLGAGIADANGTLSLNRFIPVEWTGLNLKFQAADLDNCAVSNAYRAQFAGQQ